MMLHFDTNVKPSKGDAPSCPRKVSIGRQNASSAFWRVPKGQPAFGLAYWRRKAPDVFPAPPFGGGKWVGKSPVCHFSSDGKPTNALRGYFPSRNPVYVIPTDRARYYTREITFYLFWKSCRTVTIPFVMYNNKFNRLLQGLRVAEVAGLAHTVCSLHESCSPELNADAYLHNVMADLQKLSDRILNAIRNHRLITSLENHDTHRMRCVSALVNLKKGYDKLPDASVQSHWTVLKPVFENYLPAIQAGNYQSKTALITSLLRRLGEGDMAPHMGGLVDLKTAVNQLQEAQSAFDKMLVEYQHQLLKDQTESATDLKEEIVELINQKLVVHLEAKCNEDTATYGAFAKLVDAQIRAENAKLRRRKGRKETPSVIPSTEPAG